MSGFERRIIREIERLIPQASIEVQGSNVTVIVPREYARLLMKKAKRLRKLEDKLGISIRVRVEG